MTINLTKKELEQVIFCIHKRLQELCISIQNNSYPGDLNEYDDCRKLLTILETD